MLLKALWQGDGHKVIVGIRNRAVKHFFFANCEQAQDGARMLDEAGWDTYFAPATYARKERKADAVQALGALWLDLDAGPGKPYPSWTHALLALLKWVRGQSLPLPSHVIKSGNGVHVYWRLDQAYPREQWLGVAQHLKQALNLAGVHADPARTADAASILRVPGTHNHKDPANPLPVVEIFAHERTVSLSEFQAALPQVGPSRVYAPATDEWSVPVNYPPGDADGIAARCAQMRHVRDVAGAEVPEPYWRAALSVLKRCVNGETLIHTWSQGDPRYNPKETQRKADGTAGPATCAHFSEVNPGGCAGCPHSVTSPIQLGVAAPEPAPDVEDWRVSRIGRYVVTDAGIHYNPPLDAEGQGPARVTHVPIWVVEVRERARLELEQDEASLLLEWYTPDSKTRRGVIRQSDVYDMKAFVKWFANHGLMPAIQEVKLLVGYISQLSLALVKKHGAREYYEVLGWHPAGFVTGPQVVTEEGARPALVQSTSPISRMRPKGDAAKWVDLTKVLAEPAYAKHAFVLLTGFASPLLHLCGVQSSVLSLAGPSGAGKTLAAELALSIYGSPTHLMQPASSSQNALDLHMSTLRHVPFLWDEVTSLKPYRIADFIYTAANGQSKSTLTRGREFRTGTSHALVAYMTSNHPVLDYAQRDIEEAHRRRLIELVFRDVMPHEVGSQLYEAVEQHPGSVGETYLQAVAKLKPRIPELFEQTLEELRESINIPDANRFGLWTVAVSLVAGAIAKSLGLIAFDPKAVVQQAVNALTEVAQSIETEEDRAAEVLRQWLTENSRNVAHWPEGDKGMNVLVDNPVARYLDESRIAVPVKWVNEVWQEEHIGRSVIRDWVHRMVEETKGVRLAPGTPPVRCHVFRPGALDSIEPG